MKKLYIKNKLINYILILLITILILPMIRYLLTSYIIKDYWCLRAYLESWEDEAYVYQYNDWTIHTDIQLLLPIWFNNNNLTEPRIIGKVYWCNYVTDSIIIDIINTYYCNIWRFLYNNWL